MPLDRAILERLIEVSPDIVVATAADGTVQYYNDGARENLGYSRLEIIGRYVVELYPSLEEARRVMAAMRSTEHGGPGRVVNFPTTFVAKDGHEIDVSISGVIVYDASEVEQGTIGFAKDVSEIKRRDQLAVLGEVAIGLSHEINNPLTVIESQISLLERHLRAKGEVGEVERVARIRTEIRRIEANLRRLNEMAQQESYASTEYLGRARMIDLSARPEAAPLALEARKILVVDDDPAVRESVSEILAAEGAQVALVGNGREAIERMRRERFDLVLSDVVMPEMDGYELFQAARREAPDTPVVLMTAFYYDQDHVIKRSRLEGLDGVLFKKPVNPERLVKTLAELITRARPRPS
ncbi:MAG: response regulator [Deltaproteobacteria bacterium]|nr:response regulator [Deltaproteobacteria bacterium]